MQCNKLYFLFCCLLWSSNSFSSPGHGNGYGLIDQLFHLVEAHRFGVIIFTAHLVVLIALIVTLYRKNKELNRHQGELARQVNSALYQKTKLYSYLNTTSALIAVLDRKGRLLSVNNALCKLTDTPESELLGKTWFSLVDAPKKQRKEWRLIFKKMISQDMIEYEPIETQLMSKAGRVHTVVWNYEILIDPQTKEKEMLCSGEDVTAHRASLQKLAEYRYSLERMVDERTKQLEEQTRNAQLATRVKTEFLANMSHEIRTPMNAILGLAHLMRQSSLPKEQEHRLEKIGVAASHLLSIINDLLDVSKLESGKLKLEMNHFSLAALVEQAVAMLDNEFEKKSLHVSADLSDVPDCIYADQTRLRQALVNYLSNAVKFTSQGTITISVKLVAQEENKVKLRFSVKDTGIGLKQDDVIKVFEPFEQRDASITRTHGGTGLGLTITKKLVSLMGGEAGATSREGVGSDFWFSVWVELGDPEMLANNIKLMDNKGLDLIVKQHNAKVLLVEDNDINRDVAKDMLNSVGLQVFEAKNGEEAVELVKDRKFDVVLMDVQMPVMDGLEATKKIRGFISNAELPILAMTANIFEEDRLACNAAGMDDFIAKPVLPETLYSKLDYWLPGSKGNIEFIEKLKNSKPKTVIPTSLLRSEILAAKLALRTLDGDVTKYVRLLRRFHDQHQGDVDKIRHMIAVQDYLNAISLAHALKGASAALGVVGIQSGAAMLEKDIRLENYSLLDSFLESIALNFKALWRILEDIQLSDQADNGSQADNVDELMAHIETLLSKDDTAVNKVVEDNYSALLTAYGDQMSEFSELVYDYEYLKAFNLLKEMLHSAKVD